MKRPGDYAGGDQEINLARFAVDDLKTVENPGALSNNSTTES
jgi:hypothetical protein